MQNISRSKSFGRFVLIVLLLDVWPIMTQKSIFQGQKWPGLSRQLKTHIAISMFPILLSTNLYDKDHMYPIHSKGMKKEKVIPYP